MHLGPVTIRFKNYAIAAKLGCGMAKSRTRHEALGVQANVTRSIIGMGLVCGALGSSSITPVGASEWMVVNAVMTAPYEALVLDAVTFGSEYNQRLARFARGEQRGIVDSFLTCSDDVRALKERRGSLFSEVMAVNALAIAECGGEPRISNVIIDRYLAGAQRVAHEISSTREESTKFALDLQRILERLHRAG